MKLRRVAIERPPRRILNVYPIPIPSVRCSKSNSIHVVAGGFAAVPFGFIAVRVCLTVFGLSRNREGWTARRSECKQANSNWFFVS
jgi:hypothetical protein